MVSSGIEALGTDFGATGTAGKQVMNKFGASSAFKAVMIASGGLSGGLSSAIAGGNFWSGVREGLITSGLNHLADHNIKTIQDNKAVKDFIKELQKNYPNKTEYPDSNSLYDLIGGPMEQMHDNDVEAGNANYANTCAVRISRALNYTDGLEIPSNAGDGIRTFKGNDGKNYIISAIEMVKYLTNHFGKSNFYDGTKFTARNGIIAMFPKNIEGSNVYHVDLVVKGKWIGTSGMEPKYFKIWY